MESKTKITAALILFISLISPAAKIQAQSFLLTPYGHAGLLVLSDNEHGRPVHIGHSINIGFGVDGLLGFGADLKVKTGLELGWGTLDEYYWNQPEWEMGGPYHPTSTFRILSVTEFSPGNKRLFIQAGGGVHITMPYSRVWPGFMISTGINVFKTDRICIPVVIRVECITNSSEIFIPVNLLTGITFKL